MTTNKPLFRGTVSASLILALCACDISSSDVLPSATEEIIDRFECELSHNQDVISALTRLAFREYSEGYDIVYNISPFPDMGPGSVQIGSDIISVRRRNDDLQIVHVTMSDASLISFGPSYDDRYVDRIADNVLDIVRETCASETASTTD